MVTQPFPWTAYSSAWEEYRDAVQMCRDGIRKAKARMEPSLVRDAKNNKKGFYRYFALERKDKERVSPLMDENGELLITNMEKAKVLNNFFASVFTASQAFKVFCSLKL